MLGVFMARVVSATIVLVALVALAGLGYRFVPPMFQAIAGITPAPIVAQPAQPSAQAQAPPAAAPQRPAAPAQPVAPTTSAAATTVVPATTVAELRAEIQALREAAASGPANVVAGPPGQAVTGVRCPTDAEMQAAHGFTVVNVKATATGVDVPWEGCKWTIAAVGAATIDMPLLPGWQYTLTKTHTDSPSVWYGAEGLRSSVTGATIRYRGAYVTPDNRWVNEPCRPYVSPTDKGGLLSREVSYGQGRTPAYNTSSGNIACAA